MDLDAHLNTYEVDSALRKLFLGMRSSEDTINLLMYVPIASRHTQECFTYMMAANILRVEETCDRCHIGGRHKISSELRVGSHTRVRLQREQCWSRFHQGPRHDGSVGMLKIPWSSPEIEPTLMQPWGWKAPTLTTSITGWQSHYIPRNSALIMEIGKSHTAQYPTPSAFSLCSQFQSILEFHKIIERTGLSTMVWNIEWISQICKWGCIVMRTWQATIYVGIMHYTPKKLLDLSLMVS